MEILTRSIAAACKKVFGVDVQPALTRPDEQFGDYATNIALQLAGQLGKNPRDVAEALAAELEGEAIAEVSVAGPGFINIRLTDPALLSQLGTEVLGLSPYKRVLLEYSCPNAFKELHTGHLYQTVVGDAIGRLLEATGATVFRANFGGDVGLHVAKCLYGIIETLGGEYPEKLNEVEVQDRAGWISSTYVNGAKAYEADDAAKQQIEQLNQKVYALHSQNDHESPLAHIYWRCREWSYEYFKQFYAQIQVKPFDKYYPESSTSDPGLALVKEHIGTVFKESDGAVVFDGEAVGLHTRVFITSKGLPTYETKDLGVIVNEANDFSYDKRVIITGNDQAEYMKVVFAALAQIDKELAHKQTHFTNGTVRFGSGEKMSSRLGNVTRAIEVIEAVTQTVAEQNPESDHTSTALAAVKYSFLKHRLGGDIAFDINESVSLEGNSGPYLQYAHARARSILGKTTAPIMTPTESLEADERSLARKLSQYTEVVQQATEELLPHHICTYLYELSQSFNRFYEHNRVLEHKREGVRLYLVNQYAEVLHAGLGLLGIDAPEKM